MQISSTSLELRGIVAQLLQERVVLRWDVIPRQLELYGMLEPHMIKSLQHESPERVWRIVVEISGGICAGTPNSSRGITSYSSSISVSQPGLS